VTEIFTFAPMVNFPSARTDRAGSRNVSEKASGSATEQSTTAITIAFATSAGRA